MMDAQSLRLPHAHASQTADVFGKTLVTPPPLMLEDAGAVAPVDDNSNSPGLALESVEEMDSEPSSSQPARGFSPEQDVLHQGEQQQRPVEEEEEEEEEEQRQQQQQQHLAQSQFTLAAETSV